MWLTRQLFYREVWKLHTDRYLGTPLKSTDRYWRKRVTLMQAGHFEGRRRNCFSVALRHNWMVLGKLTRIRRDFRRDFKELCDARVKAAAYEHGYDSKNMQDVLSRSYIGINRKNLANMAIWEPRTFRAISAICARKENLVHEREGMTNSSYQEGPGVEIIDRGKF